jgi:hypothetical protein
MTGLALLCFLGHGDCPDSAEFGGTVRSAIEWLQYNLDADGNFRHTGRNHVYGNGIAAYALSEAYGMTRMVALSEPVERAIDRIIKGQQAGGLWDYNYSKGGRWDMSVTAWQVQALKAAQIAGAGNSGLALAVQKAVVGLEAACVNGVFGYTTPGKEHSPDTLTGAGIVCGQFLGAAEQGFVRAAVARTAAAGYEFRMKHPRPLYYVYYMTQARFHQGGAGWEEWNRGVGFADKLVDNQAADGHWENTDGGGGGNVYSTALACLTLEVYYRCLPTYGRAANAPETGAGPDAVLGADTRVGVEILGAE